MLKKCSAIFIFFPTFSQASILCTDYNSRGIDERVHSALMSIPPLILDTTGDHGPDCYGLSKMEGNLSSLMKKKNWNKEGFEMEKDFRDKHISSIKAYCNEYSQEPWKSMYKNLEVLHKNGIELQELLRGEMYAPDECL